MIEVLDAAVSITTTVGSHQGLSHYIRETRLATCLLKNDPYSQEGKKAQGRAAEFALVSDLHFLFGRTVHGILHENNIGTHNDSSLFKGDWTYLIYSLPFVIAHIALLLKNKHGCEVLSRHLHTRNSLAINLGTLCFSYAIGQIQDIDDIARWIASSMALMGFTEKLDSEKSLRADILFALGSILGLSASVIDFITSSQNGDLKWLPLVLIISGALPGYKAIRSAILELFPSLQKEGKDPEGLFLIIKEKFERFEQILGVNGKKMGGKSGVLNNVVLS